MDLTETTIYPVILSVPESEREYRGREKVRFLSRHARIALRCSCRKSGLTLETLPKDDTGVPLPVDGVYWSLSHKSAIVGGVASPQPVGLDLETIRPVRDALLSKVADEAEWRLAGGKNERIFFRLWTAKEAVLKAVGKGMAGLSRCRIVAVTDESNMVLTYDNAPWPVEHVWFGRHVAAITSHHFSVDWLISPTWGCG
jgi:4'-phosphopantetheinyl transferase